MSSHEDIFADMENSVVIDSNGDKLGKIIDFTIDEDYQLRHFILKGKNEHVQDHFSLTSEYRLLVPASSIRRHLNDEVFLGVPFSELSMLKEISANERRFSVISQLDVLAADGENLGKVIDGLFHKDKHASFILGGSPFREFLSKIGIANRYELMIPYRYIDRMDNLIVLNKNKEDLQEVLKDTLMDTEDYRIMEARNQYSRESRLILFKDAYYDVLRQNEKRS